MNFEIYFLGIQWEIILGVLHCRLVITSLAFRRYKKEFHILKIILVQDFCPLKFEITRFLNRFHLKPNHISFLGFAKMCWMYPAKTEDVYSVYTKL